MVQVNPTNKNTTVKVSSLGAVSNIQTTTPQAYYDGLAKQWATSDKIVQGIDYSSKYYAEKSKESAQASLENKEASEHAIEEINTIRDNTLTEITTEKENSILEIKDTTVTQKNEIENASQVEQNKIKDLGIDTRADIDLSNLSEEGEKHFLNKSQITNCIKEIPQRIKLELKDGILTLKAGSQPVFPNGFESDGTTLKFEHRTIENDIVVTNTFHVAGQMMVCVRGDLSGMYIALMECFSSGANPPTETNSQLWYDTTNNLVKRYSLGEYTGEHFSFPIAIVTKVSSAEDAILATLDKTLNGISYIGSTTWIDKGVKFIVPYGRNEDGTLKNIEYITKSVSTLTNTVTGRDMFFVIEPEQQNSNDVVLWDGYKYIESETQPPDSSTYTLWYQPSTNLKKWHSTANSGWGIALNTTLGFYDRTNGLISNFRPKTTFKALDYNSKITITNWAFPSKSINLTLGASATTYTAPANGWFVFFGYNLASTGTGIYAQMISSSGLESYDSITFNKHAVCVSLPVQKGQTVYLSYNVDTSTNLRFKFIYAQGEV